MYSNSRFRPKNIVPSGGIPPAAHSSRKAEPVPAPPYLYSTAAESPLSAFTLLRAVT